MTEKRKGKKKGKTVMILEEKRSISKFFETEVYSGKFCVYIYRKNIDDSEFSLDWELGKDEAKKLISELTSFVEDE